MRQHNHYFKDVRGLSEIDVYRVLSLYEVTHPCIQHAIKKLLCAGIRGAKDQQKDWQEAVVSIQRALEMADEDLSALHRVTVTPCEVKSIPHSLSEHAPGAWLKWKGGACPVPEGTPVDVKHRDGELFYRQPARSPAGAAVRWDHRGTLGDIVEWRLHVENVAAEGSPSPGAVTPWTGGLCPVADDAMVWYRLRSGRTGETTAGNLLWSHHKMGSDIVEYRVL